VCVGDDLTGRDERTEQIGTGLRAGRAEGRGDRMQSFDHRREGVTRDILAGVGGEAGVVGDAAEDGDDAGVGEAQWR
jgi:hypothetical protein